jgi:ribonuclease P protein component
MREAVAVIASRRAKGGEKNWLFPTKNENTKPSGVPYLQRLHILGYPECIAARKPPEFRVSLLFFSGKTWYPKQGEVIVDNKVSKKATERNLCKRRVRAILQTSPCGWRLSSPLTAGAADLSFSQLQAKYRHVWRTSLKFSPAVVLRLITWYQAVWSPDHSPRKIHYPGGIAVLRLPVVSIGITHWKIRGNQRQCTGPLANPPLQSICAGRLWSVK